MRKDSVKKMSLAKETLRLLEDSSLVKAVAGNKPYSEVIDTICCSGGTGC
jgi:hypothetical protein